MVTGGSTTAAENPGHLCCMWRWLPFTRLEKEWSGGRRKKTPAGESGAGSAADCARAAAANRATYRRLWMATRPGCGESRCDSRHGWSCAGCLWSSPSGAGSMLAVFDPGLSQSLSSLSNVSFTLCNVTSLPAVVVFRPRLLSRGIRSPVLYHDYPGINPWDLAAMCGELEAWSAWLRSVFSDLLRGNSLTVVPGLSYQRGPSCWLSWINQFQSSCVFELCLASWPAKGTHKQTCHLRLILSWRN